MSYVFLSNAIDLVLIVQCYEEWWDDLRYYEATYLEIIMPNGSI